LYASPKIIRVITSSTMRWAGYVARMGDVRNVYNILIGKPEVKRALRTTCRREDIIIRLYPRVMRWEGVDWIKLAQDRNQ